MSARYRIKEHRSTYTPQKRMFGLWWNLTKPRPSLEAASQVIRARLKAEHAPTPAR